MPTLNVEILRVVFGSAVIARKVIYCVIYRRHRQTKLKYMVELVLPEYFVPSIKTLV